MGTMPSMRAACAAQVTAGYTLAGDKIQGQDYTDLAFTAPAWCLLKARSPLYHDQGARHQHQCSPVHCTV